MAPRMKKRPLDSFLGCISLKNGSLTTGILSMIAAALTMIYIIFTKDKLHSILIELSQTTIKIILVFNLFMTIVISGVLVLGVLKERKFFLVVWIILGIMLIISWVISVIYWGFYYLFEHQYLEAIVWLVIGILITGLFLKRRSEGGKLILTIKNANKRKTLKNSNRSDRDRHVKIILSAGENENNVLYFYLWLVVYSFYLKLKEEDQRHPYYRPANTRYK